MILMLNFIESYGNVIENKRYIGVFFNFIDLMYILLIFICWLIGEFFD